VTSYGKVLVFKTKGLLHPRIFTGNKKLFFSLGNPHLSHSQNPFPDLIPTFHNIDNLIFLTPRHSRVKHNFVLGKVKLLPNFTVYRHNTVSFLYIIAYTLGHF